MTPAEADALIVAAKRLAVPVASCVAARIRPDHLLAGKSWDELRALVVVLADAVDPVRLRAVVEAGEGGPAVTDRDVQLRKAHAEAVRLREAKLEVPFQVRVLDSEYRAGRKKAERDHAA